jgi:hypothetical protein
MMDLMQAHYGTVMKAFCDSRVVPFFGAGVNLCDRPSSGHWQDNGYLPSGTELSEHLADNFNYQPSDSAPDRCPRCQEEVHIVGVRERRDLTRVSQYVSLDSGLGPLYEELHSVFAPDAGARRYPTTSLHRFFAGLPAALRERNYPRQNSDPFRRRMVIITTNYDDVLETAFNDVGQPFHVVSYMAEATKTRDEGQPLRWEQGQCLHWPPDGGPPQVIDKPNVYPGLSADHHPVIVKIHGAADRNNPDHDSFVITEDHYIDYLTRSDISNLLPVPLPTILRRSNFLFLGYSLRDMNLRVILHLIRRERVLSYKSWAIQLNPQSLDQKFWQERGVDILNVKLEDYVAGLEACLRTVEPRTPEVSHD